MRLPEHTSWRRWPETETLLAACNTVNAEMRFVGGCVRDTLLGKEVTDVDLATPLPPEILKEKLEAQNIRIIPTGLSHGTITAIIGKRHFEITTLRHDVETDGRHAVVAYTDNWKEDAARRDFTVNALYADSDGNIYDYYDGVNDLQEKRIRFIGDAQQRIKEDALRILRYFRFQAQLGFKGDSEGHSACKSQARLLDKLSGERIRTEMLKTLNAEYMRQGLLTDMTNIGLIPYLLGMNFIPSIEALLFVSKLAGYTPRARLILAALCRQVGNGLQSYILERWKLFNAEASHISLLVNQKNSLTINASEAMWKKNIRQIGNQYALECALLDWSEALRENPQQADLLKEKFLKYIKFAKEWAIPVFPLTGQDLLDAGMQSGKAMGERLKKLEVLWEESDYQLTKEKLLSY